MDYVNVQWQGQPPVAVTTPYHPESTWGPVSWVRDVEAQTLSLHEVVREVLVNMVMDRLRTKGLPLMACSHTKELQLENVINGIIDSHSVMCSQAPEEQDVDDEVDLQKQHASRIIAQLTAFAKSASTGGKARKPLQQSGSLSIGKQPVQRKQPANTSARKSGNFKRQKSATGTAYKCRKCDQEFILNRDLIRHEAKHSLDRPFKCDKCDYRSETRHKCNKHVRRVHSNNKFSHYCGICGKGCRSLSAKIEHEYCHLKNEDKPFKCKYCNKGLPSQRRLDMHLRTHEEDKRIKCEMCEVKFITSSGYQSHLKVVHKAFISVHSYKCLVCDLELVKRHLLMQHMKDNHRDVGHSCTDCGMKFSSEQKLEAHMNRHHRKLPIMTKPSEVSFSIGGADKSFFMCESCGGLFADASTLAQHMVTHKEKETSMADGAVLHSTKTQQQITECHGRDQMGVAQLKTRPSTSTNTCTPKAKLGRSPNTSGSQVNQTQVIEPKTVLLKQSDKSKVTLTGINKSYKATKISDVENTATSGKHSMPIITNQGSHQSKTTDKPVRIVPSRGSFIIYTKSPDKVADMLRKGTLKLSSKGPVPGSANSSSSKDQNVHQARDPSRQVLVPSDKDSTTNCVSVGQSIPTAVESTCIITSGATTSTSKAILPIIPVKSCVTPNTQESSSLQTTTPRLQSKDA